MPPAHRRTTMNQVDEDAFVALLRGGEAYASREIAIWEDLALTQHRRGHANAEEATAQAERWRLARQRIAALIEVAKGRM